MYFSEMKKHEIWNIRRAWLVTWSKWLKYKSILVHHFGKPICWCCFFFFKTKFCFIAYQTVLISSCCIISLYHVPYDPMWLIEPWVITTLFFLKRKLHCRDTQSLNTQVCLFSSVSSQRSITNAVRDCIHCSMTIQTDAK